MNSMNTRNLIEAVAAKAGLSRADAEAAVKATLEVVRDQVAAGERVTLAGFGTFEARDRAARAGRNPQSGETMQIAAARIPAFRAASGFREQISPRS